MLNLTTKTSHSGGCHILGHYPVWPMFLKTRFKYLLGNVDWLLGGDFHCEWDTYLGLDFLIYCTIVSLYHGLCILIKAATIRFLLKKIELISWAHYEQFRNNSTLMRDDIVTMAMLTVTMVVLDSIITSLEIVPHVYAQLS